MNYENLNNNKVTLMGTIKTTPVINHELYGEKFYECNLEIERLSGNTDIIPIMISERLIQEQKLVINQKIGILGQFRSYNKLDGLKSRLVLSVFAREIIDYNENENSNLIELYGFVCKPPIYRTTPFSREICDLLIAVNRAYNKSDYIPTICWGRNARFVKDIKVGEKIYISGRVQSREYQKKYADGTCENRVAYEVSVNRIVASFENKESNSNDSGDFLDEKFI